VLAANTEHSERRDTGRRACWQGTATRGDPIGDAGAVATREIRASTSTDPRSSAARSQMTDDMKQRPDPTTADDDSSSAEGDTRGQLGLGNARPGAGSNWTPGATTSTIPATDTGDWGNRSGSGSGGQGESDMDEGDIDSDETSGTNG
jgi:hypothetical protein